MKKFDYPGFTITVTQNAILTGDVYSKKGQLFLSKDSIEIDILDNEYFESLSDSTSRYELSVEYENDSFYDLWTMDLEVNDLSCNDFIVKKNADHDSLIKFIQKLTLHDKLDNKFQEKNIVKKSKI